MTATDHKVTLYTYHGCPYAHRVHIALNELGVKYEEVVIDLDKPREPWYLQINPRGLVPSLKISSPALGGEHILIESAIIVQFLADVVPGRLAPPSNTPLGAIYRARLNFFIDTWNTKVGTLMFHLFKAASPAEREVFAHEWVKVVAKEIDPLLSDAEPFYAGSKKMTLAEVMIAPFIVRIYALAAANVLPKGMIEGLEKLPNFGRWAADLRRETSVLQVWNPDSFVKRTNERLEKMAQMKAAQGHANGGAPVTA